jgi:hypothetical protein
MVNQMHNQTGWLHRDEPVDNTLAGMYGLGISAREYLTQRTNPQMGQRTVEVLVGAADVQLTVTTRPNLTDNVSHEGPMYIRFLDADGASFGLDIDEVMAERGADVVGLDSHGRLELESATLPAAKALAYDQYKWHTPSDTAMNAYLDGLTGPSYQQGTFRFINPCPRDMGERHAFSVQVWDHDGTYLLTTEEIHCINPDPLRPSELTVTTFSDREGDALLRWSPALGAIAHHVLVADGTTLQIVPGTYQRIEADMNQYLFEGLSANVPYIFAVVGERGDDDFSDASFIIQEMTWDTTQ